MIVSHLQGGMGNQCFQFAMGYAQAKRFNTGLLLDPSSFRTDRMREYSLGLWGGIYRRFDLIYDTPIDIHENGMPYNQQIVDQIQHDSCLKGYWQTEKYFSPYSRELFKIFTPFQPMTSISRDVLREIEGCGNRSIFLTIRRTDYVNNSFHGQLPQSYYDLALEYIANAAGIDPHVFVFSDDPTWVGENFHIPYQMTVSGNFDRTVKGHLGREDEELYLMRMCSHAVMANSSYSWWGAYMGDLNPWLLNNKRVVVCPKQWFGPSSNEDPRDIPRPNWIQL
jgi:hypothetical protein